LKLLHGDCLEMMKAIPDGSVDMILCDLPYGTTRNKWDSVIPFAPLWEQYRRIAKHNATTVLTASQPFTSTLGASNIAALKYAWVWEKNAATGHLNAKKLPMKLHEDILVFSAAAHTYNPQELVPFNKVMTRRHNGKNFGKSAKENFQEFTNYPRSILRFDNDSGRVHPTQKPVALMEYLIRTYTNIGETVLDNCMGSGTTGVACVNADRRFIGIEKDDNYFEIARKRVEAAYDEAINALLY